MARRARRGAKSEATDMEIYFKQVDDGVIVACSWMRKLALLILNRIETKGSRWHYDRKKANRAVEFIERFLKIPSGRIGQPFILEPYEKSIVQCIFGFIDEDGMRQYLETFVEIARKNGKTSLAAAIELYLLIADGEGAPQIYNVATTGDQASLCFNACVKMRNQSKAISKYVRKRTSDLFCQANMGFIKPMNSNPNSLDGLDVHGAILDEVAAMRTREVYDLIKQAVSARRQPLIFSISTNGFVRDSIFDAQLEYSRNVLDGKVDDQRLLPFLYELDERDEWEDEDAWLKANPGLGTVKKLETLQDFVKKAKADPSFLPTVLTKDFNVPQNSASAWLTFDEAVNESRYDFEDMHFKYGICGFDAADTIDLTSAQMLCMRPGDDRIYERSMYWIPEEAVFEAESQGNRDRDYAPYRLWISRGLMRTVPGNHVDKRVLLEWLEELRDEEDLFTAYVGYDPWHMDDSTVRDLKAFVGASRCFPIRQGARTLSQPMKQIRADYRANRLVDNQHPINSWCRMNVEVRVDSNGNVTPYKKNGDPRNRIDGFMAEIDAYTVLLNNYDDYMSMI